MYYYIRWKVLFNIIDFFIRCFYGIGVLGFGSISFIPNIMMSTSGSRIAVYLGMIASFLFYSSDILGLLNSTMLPLYFANISLGLAILLQICALAQIKLTQIKLAQIKLAQIKLAQIKLAQIKLAQIK